MRWTRLAAILLILLLAFGGLAEAQDNQAATWELTASTAEKALETGATAEAVLEDLRARLVEQRAGALSAQEAATPRVQTLSEQLAGLGPATETEATDAPDIAARRATLQAQLEAARAPLLEAELAFNRANTLIGRIDQELRRRLTEKLTLLGPSPLNPANWGLASDHVGAAAAGVGAALDRKLTGEASRKPYLGGLPFAGLLALAAALIWFGLMPRVVRFCEGMAGRGGSSARLIWLGYGRNIARLALPLAAAFFGVAALRQIYPGGLPPAVMSAAIPLAAVLLAVSYFVATGLFNSADQFGVIDKGEGANKRARRLMEVMGLLVAWLFVQNAITDAAPFTSESRAVLFLPVCLIGAILLWPLVGILRLPRQDDGTSRASSAILVWFTRIGTVVAIAAPVAAAIGYYNLGRFLFVPTILTLLVLGVLMVVFVVLRDSADIWIASAEARETGRRRQFRLLPVFIGFGLMCVGLPVLALIWGARTTDLQEVWHWLRDGVPIGEVRFSVTELLTFILVFGIGYAITRTLQATVRNSVLPRTDLDLGARNAILSGIGYLGVFVAAILAITSTGIDLSNLAIVAGALSVGIGFGLQTIVSNFVSGIILLIERPIKEGDWIEVGGHAGFVKGISVRSTEIETFDRASVIVPNADLIAGTVMNRTHDNLLGRVTVPVGVAYGSDTRQVEAILSEIAKGHEMVLADPAPGVFFTGFGADSMDFEIRAHIRNVLYVGVVASDMNHEIAARFAAEGIEIPFAQRDINLRNAEAIVAAFKGEGAQ